MSDLSGKKILVVDDEAQIRVAFRSLITKNLQCQVLEATNGREAIDIVVSENPDVIVTDIRMPEMDGIEFLAALRENGIGTPVIVVTGYGDKETMRRAWQLGASDFLEKPVTASELAETIRVCLEVGSSEASKGRGVRLLGTGQYREISIFFLESEFAELRELAYLSGKSVTSYIYEMASEQLRLKKKAG